MSKCFLRRRIEPCFMQAFWTFIIAKAYPHWSAVCDRWSVCLLTYHVSWAILIFSDFTLVLVAWLCNWKSLILAIKRLMVRLLARCHCTVNLGKLFAHPVFCVPLTPRIIWYWLKGSDACCCWGGNQGSG